MVFAPIYIYIYIYIAYVCILIILGSCFPKRYSPFIRHITLFSRFSLSFFPHIPREDLVWLELVSTGVVRKYCAWLETFLTTPRYECIG